MLGKKILLKDLIVEEWIVEPKGEDLIRSYFIGISSGRKVNNIICKVDNDRKGKVEEIF